MHSMQSHSAGGRERVERASLGDGEEGEKAVVLRFQEKVSLEGRLRVKPPPCWRAMSTPTRTRLNNMQDGEAGYEGWRYAVSVEYILSAALLCLAVDWLSHSRQLI